MCATDCRWSCLCLLECDTRPSSSVAAMLGISLPHWMSERQGELPAIAAKVRFSGLVVYVARTDSVSVSGSRPLLPCHRWPVLSALVVSSARPNRGGPSAGVLAGSRPLLARACSGRLPGKLGVWG